MQKWLTDNTYIELFTSEEKICKADLAYAIKTQTGCKQLPWLIKATRIIQNYDSLLNPIMAFVVHSLKANISVTIEAMQVGNMQVQNLKHLTSITVIWSDKSPM